MNGSINNNAAICVILHSLNGFLQYSGGYSIFFHAIVRCSRSNRSVPIILEDHEEREKHCLNIFGNKNLWNMANMATMQFVVFQLNARHEEHTVLSENFPSVHPRFAGIFTLHLYFNGSVAVQDCVHRCIHSLFPRISAFHTRV